MSRNNKIKTILVGMLVIAGAASLVLTGCQSQTKTTSAPVLASTAAPAKGGAQLWAETCTRCHNSRPPTEFSAAQWDIVMHHMRLRANLTGKETRKVEEFLQASN